MTTIEVRSTSDLAEVIKKMEDAEENELKIRFVGNGMVQTNALHLHILQAIASDLRKTVVFETDDEKQKDFIESANANTLEVEEMQVEILDTNTASDYQSTDASVLTRLMQFPMTLVQRVRQSRGNGPSGSPDMKAIHSKKKLDIAVLSFIGVCGFFGFLYWMIPTATVSLTVNSEVLVKLVDVQAVAGTKEISAETTSIPAYLLEVSENDTKTNPTTGSKEQGDKASGTITFVNKTDSDITVDKGTIVKLISTKKDKIEYVTKEKITVAKQTEDLTDPLNPKKVYGEKDVSVEASLFGTDYNQDVGQKFQITKKDTDDIVGENEKKISGGTQETVKFVTAEDVATITRELTDTLKSKAKESLDKKVVSGQELLDSSVVYGQPDISTDKKADETAENVTATGKLDATALAYSKDDLDKLVKEVAKTIVPPEYQLQDEVPTYEVAVSGISADKKTLTLQVKLRSSIAPQIDSTAIRERLSGMSLSDAEVYLQSLKNISEFKVSVAPRLPGVLQRMPLRQKNIVVSVEN